MAACAAWKARIVGRPGGGGRSDASVRKPASAQTSAVTAAGLASAPDLAGRLYYTTMVQDEGRHAEAWLKLVNEVGGVSEANAAGRG